MAQPDPSSPIADAPPPHPSARRRALGFVLVAVGVSLFGLLLFRLLAPRPVPSPQVVRYSPEQAADARKDFDALGAQLAGPPPLAPPHPAPPTRPRVSKALSPSAPTPTPAIVRLRLSEADLNTYLATDPKVKTLLASHGVQAVQLFLQEPRAVTCRAAILYKGRRNNVQITGDLLPDRDTVARFVATRAQVGALPLPPKLVTAQANRIAGQFLGRMRGRLSLTVQDIQVVGDHLILTGIRRPVPKR